MAVVLIGAGGGGGVTPLPVWLLSPATAVTTSDRLSPRLSDWPVKCPVACLYQSSIQGEASRMWKECLWLPETTSPGRCQRPSSFLSQHYIQLSTLSQGAGHNQSGNSSSHSSKAPLLVSMLFFFQTGASQADTDNGVTSQYNGDTANTEIYFTTVTFCVNNIHLSTAKPMFV